ncbi:uncharacterized protein [Littorina saxatilis]|uniref:uncharacterized protein n=1 Tax=Littorina saxatilis TaxID=31220 RepID=UPI0038B57F6A
MRRTTWLRCLQAFTILGILSSVSGQCAKFEFPTLTNPNSYTAEMGVQIALPFLLDTHDCTDLPETSTITVSKRTGDIVVDVCKLVTKRDGTCFSFRPEECVCWEEKGRYALSKIMDKSDITLWSWKIGNDGQIAAERKISFDMLPYPPSVEQLTFNSISDQASFSHPLEPSMSVDINCTYDKGYPETSAGLLKDSKGIRLAASRDDGNEQAGTVRHTLTDISCDDMGDISCEVPGASKNLTKALLVKCPPKLPNKDLQLVSHFGLHNELRIPLSSYTKQLRSCKVAKVIQGHHQNQGLDEGHQEHKEKACGSFASYNVLGSPPNLILLLLLDDVSLKDVGEWNLTVANDVGTDDVTFKLEVKTAPNITKLFLESATKGRAITYPVEVNSSVEIFCEYNKGDYPETTAVLKNAQNVELAGVQDDNKLATRFTLLNVGCDDSGEISCELTGAVKQKVTESLPVKCPPKFTEKDNTIFESNFGDRVELRFQLLTHTDKITRCHITRVIQGHHNGKGHSEGHTELKAEMSKDCLTFASEPEVKGTLPKGTLELRVDKVTPDHSGTWRLTISNEEGSDDLTFTLKVTGEPPAVSEEISPGVKTLIGIVGFLVVIITVIVLCVVIIKKKRKHERAAIRARNATRQGDGLHTRGSGSHFYQDIPDEANLAPTRCDRQGQAAPAGPYDSLEMSDVGHESPYSQI